MPEQCVTDPVTRLDAATETAALWQTAGSRPKTYASVKLRVTAGSTGMPGPVVVDTTTFFR